MSNNQFTAVAIVIDNNDTSTKGFQTLVQSSKDVGNQFEIEKVSAVIPSQVQPYITEHNLRWNYPNSGHVYDFQSGLKKTAYQTKNITKRVACFLSHYKLWKRAAENDETLLVLEHDAKFIRKFVIDLLDINLQQPYIIGINDPRGATRKASVFHEIVQKSPNQLQRVPKIDSINVPQGLAGNSAYLITSKGGQRMLELTKAYGMWPNDALMCYQLVGSDILKVTKQYYTKVQGLPSTTTL